MIRHAVLFRFADSVTDAQIRAMTDGLEGLPEQIPEIRAYTFGPAVRLDEGSWDYAVVADFDSADDWETYRAHPAHQAVLTERIGPAGGERVSVQFDLGD